MNLQPPIPPPPANAIPSRESSSDAQFDTVLSVLNALAPFLLVTQREIDAGIPAELDGGISLAALSTFTKACDRLDGMLSDETRWNLNPQDELYAAMSAHYNGAAKMHESQIHALNEMRRPCNVRKPRLTTINGEFIALWGDPSLPGGLILGRGPTPEAALTDYDSAFLRNVGEQLRFAPESEDWLKNPAPLHPAELPPEARHKKRRTRKKY